MPITDTTIVREERVKITITEITKEEKPSKHYEGTYTLARIVDQNGRSITACGKWVKNWKEGDDIEGVLQEKRSSYSKDALSGEEFITSLYLADPQWN